MNKSYTTNIDLLKLAKKYDIPLNGVCMKDELNYIEPKKGGYIVNLESSNEGSGTHWVAIYVPFNNSFKKKSEYNDLILYFDSFGVVPPLDVIEFAKKKGDLIYNEKEIQNINSGYCGQYCLLFIHEMYNKEKCKKNNIIYDYENFIDLFEDTV